MAVSIDWGTRVITIPRADMPITQVSPEVRSLDLAAFRLELKDLEDDAAGMPHPDTHRHNTTVVLSGVTYARTIEIINGYTVEFEDGQYTVVMSGANSNVLDVKVANQVGVLGNNSAGLIETGSGLDASQAATLATILKVLTNRMHTDPTTGVLTIYDDDDSTVLLSGALWEDVLATQGYRGDGADRRDRLT